MSVSYAKQLAKAVAAEYDLVWLSIVGLSIAG